jgi:hypothetical protein
MLLGTNAAHQARRTRPLASWCCELSEMNRSNGGNRQDSFSRDLEALPLVEAVIKQWKFNYPR